MGRQLRTPSRSLVILLIHHRALNALLLGEEAAGTLGFNVGRLQKILVLIASLLAGVTISVSGSIGFVGLMVPHLTRLIVGSNHKNVLPVSAILGGYFSSLDGCGCTYCHCT